jgi:hypothetical protein
MTLEPAASLERQIGMRVSVVLLALAVAGCASGHAAAPRYSSALVSVQVVVPSRTMEAGSSMLAHIVVDNRTGHAIHANGCGQLFELALGSDSYPAQAGWPACLQPLTIAAGKTSYPWTIRATYDSCGGTGIQPQPACLPGGGAPPLPAGQYRVVFFQISDLVSEPAPIPVQVTPRSLHRAAPRGARKKARVCRTDPGVRPGRDPANRSDGGQLSSWAIERAMRKARSEVKYLPAGFRYHDLRHASA